MKDAFSVVKKMLECIFFICKKLIK